MEFKGKIPARETYDIMDKIQSEKIIKSSKVIYDIFNGYTKAGFKRVEALELIKHHMYITAITDISGGQNGKSGNT